MPPTEKHFEMSLARTGKDYADLHRWIDAAEHKNERPTSPGSGSSARNWRPSTARKG